MNPELFVTPKSLVLDDDEKKLLADRRVGGVVLFGINLGSADEIKALNDSIHTIREDLVIATDEEGGLVSRLYHVIPSNSQQYVALQGEDEAYGYYLNRAKAMRELGFDLNLAPVVDIAPNRDSIMYKRAYGPDAQAAVIFAGVCIRAQKDAGLASCIKHFPGLGKSSVDSHLDVPSINDSFDEWLASDGMVYGQLARLEPEYTMVGHVMYPRIDNQPASSSGTWIKRLRQILPDTKILTDDVTMEGFDDSTRLSDLADYGVDGVLVKDQRHKYVSGHDSAYTAVTSV